ncbi:MAG: glycoside hydrolase family 57 protein [Chitinophagaceae bacterium]|nr:glycoside hydrolase family 57 protein [Chitinophagaceae bacterium]
MTSVCLYFKVHQPYRLKKYSMKGVDLSYCYADATADSASIHFLADNSYLPANKIIREQLLAQQGKFSVSYSISGTVLELLRKHRPDVIASFQKLVDTGYVEILAETYYHSLSSLHSKKEFRRQIRQHGTLVKELFGIHPAVFRNTELIHNNALAGEIADTGLRGILCEGVKRILNGRTPNKLYSVPGKENIGLFLRNAQLSDDIAFRFDDVNWNEHPLTAEKFADWLQIHPADTSVINLMMDYETFGVHKKPGSGIFEFLEALPAAILANNDLIFSTPTEILDKNNAEDSYDVPATASWENDTTDACLWCDNMEQNKTLKKIYSIENMVLNCGHEKAIDMWGRLQSADYFYYMSEESSKRTAYKYHNPFATPEEAFQNYSNIVADLEIALIENEIRRRKRTPAKASFINTIL